MRSQLLALTIGVSRFLMKVANTTTVIRVRKRAREAEMKPIVSSYERKWICLGRHWSWFLFGY